METQEQVIEAIHQHGLGHLLDKLEPLILPSIRIRYAKEQPAEIPVGTSRIGGLPDLPPSIAYPNWRGIANRDDNPAGPLVFAAQFNLSEIAAYDVAHQLPSTGMLYFFAATWVNVINDWDGVAVDAAGEDYHRELWRVFYYNGDLSEIKPVSPGAVSEELKESCEYGSDENAPPDHQFIPVTVEFSTEWTLPAKGWINPYVHPYALSEEEIINDEERELYDNLLDAISESTENTRYDRHIHRLLGHPEIEQVYPPDKETILLLQLGSENLEEVEWGFSWEFSGKGYFFIRPDDLANLDFSRVDLEWEVD